MMVETQTEDAQVLIGDIDDFQILYLINGSWVDDFNFIINISLIEITLRARSTEPFKNYVDPVYGDAYKRIELKVVIRPKNIIEQS